MAEVNDAGTRRDRPLDPRSKLRMPAGIGNGKGNLRDLDSIASRALVPGREHAAVILVGGHHLVAGLEVDAELRGLQRFTRVARDRKLFGVASRLGGEPAAHRLDARLEHLRHEGEGGLVGQVEISLEGFVHHPWARRAEAVVQVDEGAIERESLLDLAPVAFIGGDLVRGAVSHVLAGAFGVDHGGGRQDVRNAERAHITQQFPPAEHRCSPRAAGSFGVVVDGNDITMFRRLPHDADLRVACGELRNRLRSNRSFGQIHRVERGHPTERGEC